MSREGHAAHVAIVDLLRERLSAGARVLDAPAGRGDVSRLLRDAGFGAVSADIATESFAVEGMRCERADLNARLPFENASFDAYVCSEGLEHLERPWEFAREAARVVRPGGWLVVTTPNLLSLGSRFTFLLTGLRSFKARPQREGWSDPGGQHINLMNFYQVRLLLHMSGFRIRTIRTCRLSATAFALAWMIPLQWLYTLNALRREPDPAQREANREILKQVISFPLLFGRKLVLAAERTAQSSQRGGDRGEGPS